MKRLFEFNIISVFTVIIFFSLIKPSFSQDILSLSDVIMLAKKRSPESVVAKHEFRRSYWEYRSFTADYLPSLKLDATLPNFNRTISKITQPDGSDAFVERRLADYTMDLAISQKLPITGGEFFINSGLQRIDLFQDSTNVSYQSTPVSIGYRQPVFGYNALKWDREIEPLKYEESEKEYLEKVEMIAVTATDYFFALLKAQINIDIATKNKANTDTLYKIAKGRYNLGKIAENELLQMELSMLNAGAQLDQAKINYEINLFQLMSFLGTKGKNKIELIPPQEHPDLTIDVEKAMSEAMQNRAHEITNQKQLAEALRNLSQAKSENRFNANLFALYGLTSTSKELSEVYANPQDQQQLSLGVQIPILDWGVGKGKVKMAESNYELIKTAIEQKDLNFEQEILLTVMTFNMRAKQLQIAAKADTVAQKRFDVAKQRYLIGKIGITDLNIALNEKDQARQNYYNSLQAYWRTFYLMRKLTLYNFLSNEKITVNFRDIY